MEPSDQKLSAALNNLGLKSLEELTQFTASITPQENLTQIESLDETDETSDLDPNEITDFQIYRDIPVPDKIYFRIGEVAKLLELKTYVLRFWENEFDSIKPLKSNNGQRIYKKKHVLQLIEIKRLLYTEKYSISGARKALAQRIKENPELRGESKANTQEASGAGPTTANPKELQIWSQELIYPPPAPLSTEEQQLHLEIKAELLQVKKENEQLKKEQEQIILEYHKREVELKEQILMVKARLLTLKEKLTASANPPSLQ